MIRSRHIKALARCVILDIADYLDCSCDLAAPLLDFPAQRLDFLSILCASFRDRVQSAPALHINTMIVTVQPDTSRNRSE